MKIKLLIVTALFLIISCNAWAATYYVAPTAQVAAASDSNAGTDPTAPWETIAKVVATATSGDTVYFHSAGTWQNSTMPVLECKAGITYDGSTWGGGTRATLQATNGNGTSGVVQIYVSDVTLTGFNVDANRTHNTGINIGFNAESDIDNILVDDCKVYNYRDDTDHDESVTEEYYYGIIIGQSNLHLTSNVTVQNTEVHHWGHEGITCYPSRSYSGSNFNRISGITVRNCNIHDTGIITKSTQSGGDNKRGRPLDVGLYATNTLFEFNYIYNPATSPFGVGVISYSDPGLEKYPKNTIIRYNIINCSGLNACLTIGGSGVFSSDNDGYFYGNIIMGGIAINGVNHANATQKVYNNTIYQTLGSAARGLYVSEYGSNYAGIELRNNIVYSNAGSQYLIYDVGEKLTTSQHSNNLVYVPSGNCGWVKIGGVLATKNMTTIDDWEATIVAADPTFTGGDLPTCFSDATGVCGTGTYGTNLRPNTTYFSLKAGSPALGAGATLGSPYNGAINWAGTNSLLVRPSGGYDIGAHQLSGSSANTGAMYFGVTF